MDSAALASLREALIAARDAYPDLRRGIGQLLPALDARLGLPSDEPRRERRGDGLRADALAGRGARRR